MVSTVFGVHCSRKPTSQFRLPHSAEQQKLKINKTTKPKLIKMLLSLINGLNAPDDTLWQYLALCRNSTLETVVTMALYESTFTIPYHTTCDRLWKDRHCTLMEVTHWRIFTRTWLRYVRVFAVAIPSVVCLSVTLVHPTQGVEPFGKISSPLCTLAILWPPCKILRR